MSSSAAWWPVIWMPPASWPSADLEYDNVPVGKSYGHDGLKAILGGLISGTAEVEWVVHRQLRR